MPAAKPTELSRIKLKNLELNNLSQWWVSIQSTGLHCRNPFTLGSGDIHICCLILIVLWDRAVISNWKWTSCFPLLNARFGPWKSETPNRQQTEKKHSNSTASPMMSGHSAHFTSLPDLVHPWLWRNRYLHNYMHTYICVCCFEFRRSSTDKRFSNWKETSSLYLLNQGFQAGKSETSKSPANWMHTHKWSYRGSS